MIGLLFGCPPPVDTDLTEPPCGQPSLAAEPTWEGAERTHATGLAWADVNGDGFRDLVVASGNDQAAEPITVHTRGSFGESLEPQPDWTSATVAFHGHVAVGDLDDDGYDDVVATRFIGDDDFATPGGVDLYRGGPDGLIEPPAWSVEGLYTFGADLGDVDGDGDLDLALAVGEPYHHDPLRQVVFTWDSGFAGVPDWTSDDEAHAIDATWVDVDGDGDLDLAQARSGSPHVVYENVGGTLAALPMWAAPGSAWDGIAVESGDANGDGAVDLLITDNNFSGGPGLVRVFCGPGLDVCFERGAGEAWSAAALFDLDDDGALDVVAGQWFGPITAWRFDEEAPFVRTSREVVAEAFAWEDVGSDGRADLAVSDWDPDHGPVIFEREVADCSQ